MTKNDPKLIGLSIVIPVYNAKPWIAPTIQHIVDSLKGSAFDVEIIIVDDGSTDGSGEESRRVAKHFKKVPIQTIRQSNAGRYLARKHGVELSTKNNILFIDSRVFIDENSLHFLATQLTTNQDQIWNGHVNIDKKGNIFARFWDAIVLIAWRKYFRHPKTTSFTIEEFDYYPKGTGFFFVPKKRLIEAMEYFESTTNDLKHSSDDTLLIRFLNKNQPIHISPQFSCLYHGRSTLSGFLKHAYGRGQFFIDGFLRPGTRFFYPLVAILILSILGLMGLMVWPLIMSLIIVLMLIVFVCVLFAGGVFFGLSLADAGSLALLGVPFAVVYLAGLWRGLVRKVVK